MPPGVHLPKTCQHDWSSMRRQLQRPRPVPRMWMASGQLTSKSDGLPGDQNRLLSRLGAHGRWFGMFIFWGLDRWRLRTVWMSWWGSRSSLERSLLVPRCCQNWRGAPLWLCWSVMPCRGSQFMAADAVWHAACMQVAETNVPALTTTVERQQGWQAASTEHRGPTAASPALPWIRIASLRMMISRLRWELITLLYALMTMPGVVN